MNYLPCELCWYQPILMYPLVVVLGVAAYEGNTSVWKSGLPLSVLRLGVAGSHTFIQVAPDAVSSTCTVGGCTGVVWRGLGLFTIPRLSLTAFELVAAGLVVARADRR